MKIMWIVNSALGPVGEKLYGSRTDGSWMGALLACYKEQEEYDLVIVTTGKIKETTCIQEDNIQYCILPDNPPVNYDENKKENIDAWEQLLKQEAPDLILVWGTEFTHGLCALRLAKKVPSIVYMQGYLESIARYYYAGISDKELRRSITFRDIIKRDSIQKQRDKYLSRTATEREIISLSGRIITENRWCEESIKSIVPTVKNYNCALSINSVFAMHDWSIEKAERHSIICTASGYPLKGLHMVLRALAILKVTYPDVKLYVPGPKMVSDGSLIWYLRKRGYTKYIEKLIKKLDIEDNVCWLGVVSQEKLASYYEKSRVFVLSSSIENHSSSLKEAMMVGVPSVTTIVGGIPEYATDEKNALLYRFEEYDLMAYKIHRIFESDELAEKLSKNAKAEMRTIHGSEQIYNRMNQIIKEVIRDC